MNGLPLHPELIVTTGGPRRTWLALVAILAPTLFTRLGIQSSLSMSETLSTCVSTAIRQWSYYYLL
jgi:hypothetical protein